MPTKPITHRPLMTAGRKRKEPPRNAAAQIEALAADGWSKLGIAKKLYTSFDTLNRWLEEQPELQEAFNNGRENERFALHSMLFKKATEKGDSIAAMFLLKARHGYREGDQSESGNKVQINFQLPGAMSMAEFGSSPKVIDNGNSGNRDERVSTQGAIVPRGS